jgi:Zn-dependent protease
MSAVPCPGCGTEYGATAVVCPRCHRLVHGEELRRLGGLAEAAREKGDRDTERGIWGQALPLLPPGSRQLEAIEKRIAEHNEGARAKVEPPRALPSWAKAGGALTGIALVLWKAKGVLVLVGSKLKFLGAGLTKGSTMFSFLASWGVYWTLWGWRYALGFLAAMYIHEMGHVAALRRFGIPASAPMFVPGLGAFVRMNQHPKSVGEDARIGLAGPEWGLGAVVAAYAAYWATSAPIWAAIGYSAAFLNLFNLLPIWQLDGGRGFAALTRAERLVVTATLGLSWWATQEGVLGLIGVVALYQALFSDRPERGDSPVLLRFVGLILAFSGVLILGRPPFGGVL